MKVLNVDTPECVRACASIALAACLLSLIGCGSSSQTPSTANFSGTGSNGSTATVQLVLASDQLTGGASTQVTVTLSQPAPSGGADVQLTSSDAAAAAVPGTVAIPAGQTSATAALTTSAVTASTSVQINAQYDGSVSGAALTIVPPSTNTAKFSDSLAPASVTIAEGKSGTSKLTTKIASGYNHALSLSASNLPTGVTVTFSPSTIPAPGTGSSTATINVVSSVAAGTYSLKLTASDGTNSASSTLTLKVSASNPGATFKACWYKSGGHSYQGVTVGVSNPGTYSFNALLYSDTKCTVYADQFGYGQELQFGTFDYIFWFDHYPDKENYSALWYVGSDTSACLVYTTSTPTCN